MIRRPPRSTLDRSSAASDVYKRQVKDSSDNTFSIQNILPLGATIKANVPYPTLIHGKPEDVGMSSKLLGLVDKLIQDDISNGFPGASLIVVKNGVIVKQEAYGYARKYTDEGKLMDKFQPVKKDTLFDVASNTKMFSAIFSLMNLHYKKQLDYTHTVHSYIQEYKGKDSKGYDREKIDVFDVLTHIAGYASSYHFHIKGRGCYSRNKHDTAQCIYNKVDLSRERGGEPLYSDIDYIVAGLLVERISGKELDEYVRENVYKPLGAKRTTYKPLKNGFAKEDAAATEIFGNTRNFTVKFNGIREKVIQGEVHDEVSYYSMNEASGHAGLFSTTGDMAVLAQVLLNRGGYGNVKLWNRDTQDLFVKPYDLGITYGIGWRRQGNEDLTWHFGTYGSNEAIGHTGWTGTVTVIDPKHDLSVILLTNKKHSPCIKGQFEADSMETGRYGSVMNLVYESFLNA
eukprot:TRINITY_DN7021_c0_g1_i9.p1 TRINITY_DN7021_c0_g1~~TRINITY_DN7021_c0_g1_i9.p1  ORF type:complete len:471 (-),score=144.08 TRINITY_DN7021_c0_g1_i9:144-1514(-)